MAVNPAVDKGELQMSESILHRALDIKRSLGVRRAAGYLRRRGVPFSVALLALTGQSIVRAIATQSAEVSA